MKSLYVRLFVTVISVFLFASTGCAESPASLVGTYSIEEHGQLKEFIRIEKQGDKYLLSEKQSDRWLSPAEVTSVSKEDLEEMLKESVKVQFTGLGNNNVALIRVPKGWKSGQFTSTTGFWLATMLGPLELHKN